MNNLDIILKKPSENLLFGAQSLVNILDIFLDYIAECWNIFNLHMQIFILKQNWHF